MVSYPLTLPSGPNLSGITIRPVDVDGMTQSPYTGSQQVVTYPGQWWEADITLPPLTKAQRGEWNAFFLKLRGRKGTFLLGDPAGRTPTGAAAVTPGVPVVDGVHAVGAGILNMTDGGAGLTAYLKAGNYIQIGTGSAAKLHMVLDDADTDGAGAAALNIWPNIQTALAGGETIAVSGCKGIFCMTSAREWKHTTDGVTEITGFTAITALRD